MIAIVDYGVGNLFSLASSLRFIGEQCEVTSDAGAITRADRVILPGVGAFGDAMEKLAASGLVPTLRAECKEGGKPLLGICLGMQLLFEKSLEYGEHKGLGFLKGSVVPFELGADFKVPHMGWNSLKKVKDCPLLSGVNDGDFVYYVHSFYAADCKPSLVAVSEYGGVNVSGIVACGSIYGTQFHPEKSGKTGLNILKNFAKI